MGKGRLARRQTEQDGRQDAVGKIERLALDAQPRPHRHHPQPTGHGHLLAQRADADAHLIADLIQGWQPVAGVDVVFGQILEELGIELVEAHDD